MSHLDETGTVMACCRHNILYKAINMKRGEMYAYPLFVHMALRHHNSDFFAQDVVSQYRPWLERLVKKRVDLDLEPCV